MSDPGIEVTVRDLKTGETETKTIINDYLVITHGRCYWDSAQAYGNGTHVITIKRRSLPEEERTDG